MIFELALLLLILVIAVLILVLAGISIRTVTIQDFQTGLLALRG